MSASAASLPLWGFWGRSTNRIHSQRVFSARILYSYRFYGFHDISHGLRGGLSAQQAVFCETTLLHDFSRLGVCHVCLCGESVWHASNLSGAFFLRPETSSLGIIRISLINVHLFHPRAHGAVTRATCHGGLGALAHLSVPSVPHVASEALLGWLQRYLGGQPALECRSFLRKPHRPRQICKKVCSPAWCKASFGQTSLCFSAVCHTHVRLLHPGSCRCPRATL